MKKYSFIVAILFALMFSGCSSTSLNVEAPFSKLISSKKDSYVVFARPGSFLGGAHNIDIMEFDINEFNPKAVIHLANDEYTVYKVKPGKSYFFTNVGANENITMINLKPGEIQYINMGVTLNSVFAPIIIDNSRIHLKQKLLNMECNNEVLNRYLFSEISLEDNNKNDLIVSQSDASVLKYNSPLQFEMTCKDGKITNIKDTFHGTSIPEIKQLQLVKPNEDYIKEIKNRSSEFSSDIKTLYPIWDLKIKNIPISERPVVYIYKDLDKENFQKFGNIEVEIKSLNNKVSDSSYNNFKENVSKKFSDINQSKKTLKLIFEINNMDDGSMAGRYLTSGFSAAGAIKDVGVLDVTVNILDNETSIGKLRLTTIEGGGLFGGINTMTSDVLDIVKKYVSYNYIKQN